MTVHAYPDILRGAAGPVIEIPRPKNATLAELIALVPLEQEALRPHLRARLNGEIIEARLYKRIRPKDGAFVTLYVPLHGGGDSGTILATVAAIALLGASLYVGAFGLPLLGSLFAAGTVGASLLSGGLAIGASLLLQGLKTSVGDSGSKAASEEVGVAGVQNSFELGAYLQKVLGTRRVAPQMIMPPFTTFEGLNQTVTAAYGLAGPHQIEDVRIGNAAAATDENVELEIREGFDSDLPISFLDKTVIETPSGLVLSDFVMVTSQEASNVLDTSLDVYTPQWHRLESRDSPDEQIINFALTRGLFNTSPDNPGLDEDIAGVTALRVRFRSAGDVIWRNLPEFVLRGRRNAETIRFAIRFVWTDAGSIPAATAFSANWQGFSWKYNSVADTAGPWVADAYFQAGDGHVDWEDSQHIAVYLDEAAFPQGRTEFEVMRGQTIHSNIFNATTHVLGDGSSGTPILNSFFDMGGSGTTLVRGINRYAREIAVSAMQSVFDEAPFDFTGQPTAVIAIRAKNKNVDQVSCLASGYTEDWNGATWVADQITANPASWYREVLSGAQNAEPMAPSLVDQANLQAWHAWCQSEGLAVNAIVRGQPVTEVLSIIAQAGFARPRYGATQGVVIDRRRDAVGLITQRNASGFAFTKPFARLPHALKINFADEDNEYEVGEITVYAEGYNGDGSGGLIEASRFEFVTYPGITRQTTIEARARRDMAFGKNRSRLVSLTMDIEHLEFTIGDRVWVETDILGQIGGRGRVKEVLFTGGGLVSGIRLDEERFFPTSESALLLEDDTELLLESGDPLLMEDESAAPRGVAIRLEDGTVLTKEATADDSDLRTVMFATPFAMPTYAGGDQIVAGTLLATGALGQEARDMLIWDIAPGPDLTASITAIDYAETAIYGGSGFDSGFSSGFGQAI